MQYRCLRRLEAHSGVWLRYRNWFQAQALCYLGRPGVTPEAAAVALAHVARSAPAEALPLARVFAMLVLGALPLFLLLIASSFLQFWLATQWLPG